MEGRGRGWKGEGGDGREREGMEERGLTLGESSILHHS